MIEDDGFAMAIRDSGFCEVVGGSWKGVRNIDELVLDFGKLVLMRADDSQRSDKLGYQQADAELFGEGFMFLLHGMPFGSGGGVRISGNP